MIKFCQAHKASPKFIDQVIIKVMQHSSFDATCNTEEKAALMGTVFKMLHNLIDSQQIERTTNILMDLKTYIIELGEQQIIFRDMCANDISNFDDAYARAFPVSNKTKCIVESDEDDGGNLKGFIDSSCSDDDNSASSRNDDKDSGARNDSASSSDDDKDSGARNDSASSSDDDKDSGARNDSASSSDDDKDSGARNDSASSSDDDRDSENSKDSCHRNSRNRNSRNRNSRNRNSRNRKRKRTN
jgi:hypothetical protein